MLSTPGWRGVFPPSLSRDTRTTSSATAEAKKKPAGSGMLWRSASRTCRLVLHPTKTKLVYCKDTNRRGDFPVQSFDFLGYAFRPKQAVWHGSRYGTSFLPAASPKALKAIRQTIRRWALHHRTDKSLADLARMFRPYIQGWINYYSHFYKSELTPTLQRIDAFLLRWAHPTSSSGCAMTKGAKNWLARVVRATHFISSPIGAFCMRMAEHREPYDLGKSHVRFWERVGVRSPRATRQVVISIAGEPHWLWRAVDQNGIVLDVLVQRRRDTRAAQRLMKRLLKSAVTPPRVMITDKLRSLRSQRPEEDGPSG